MVGGTNLQRWGHSALILLSCVLAMLLVQSPSPAVIASAGAALLTEGVASAPLIHYQGRLLDPTTGQPKPDGAYQMAFSLYDVGAGGAPLWTEIKSVGVSRGLFATLLGDVTPLNLAAFDGRDLYLGVTVGSDPEATPRQRMAHVAYAIRAENADTLDGLDASALAAASHTHTGADLVDDSVGLADLANASVLTMLNVSCTSLSSFSTGYAKIVDVGTFAKQDANSLIEITFNGRIAVIDSLTGTGAIFEVRIDDLPTTQGRARASFKSAEVGDDGVPVSITGIFTGLGAGPHTVSIWMRAANGAGSRAMVDPGCWSSDHIVVREFK
jgi:hypothetical protein